MSVRTLHDAWREYRDTVYPGGTTSDQSRQLKQCFFSACLVSIMELQKAAEDLSDADAMQRLEELYQEAFQFLEARAASCRPESKNPNRGN